jgi:hypothetical protein
MMFLGRNTVQWLALVALLLQAVSQFFPDLPPLGQTILNFLTGVDAILIAWIVQTSVTPISDPRLTVGTVVTVTNPAGETLTKHTLP